MLGGGLIQQLGIEATEDVEAAEGKRLPHITTNGVNYDTGLGIRDGGIINRDFVLRLFSRKGIESHL